MTKYINFLIIMTELRVGLSKIKKGGNENGYREMTSVY